MTLDKYYKVDDIITRSPHLSKSFKRKYANDVRKRKLAEYQNGTKREVC